MPPGTRRIPFWISADVYSRSAFPNIDTAEVRKGLEKYK